MVAKVLFSSKTSLWSTPQDLYNTLDKEFNFDLDAAADQDNRKCERWLGPGSLLGENSLLVDVWPGNIIFLNPPYGRGVTGEFVKKAYQQSLLGKTVVLLLPARTDTKWWHSYCELGEKRFIKGRLKFGGSKNSAPFPSVIVVLRPPLED